MPSALWRADSNAKDLPLRPSFLSSDPICLRVACLSVAVWLVVETLSIVHPTGPSFRPSLRPNRTAMRHWPHQTACAFPWAFVLALLGQSTAFYLPGLAPVNYCPMESATTQCQVGIAYTRSFQCSSVASELRGRPILCFRFTIG